MSEEKAFCRTDDLAIGYGKTPLMEHIRLGAEKGSILTLIGPNGAGKSTVMGIISRLIAKDSGLVSFDGTELEKWKSKADGLWCSEGLYRLWRKKSFYCFKARICPGRTI